MRLKYLFTIGFAFFLFAQCQKESTTSIDQESEENFTDDADYIALLQQISSHAADYDDLIDQSSCFSIDFPYACYVNGLYVEYQEPADLSFLRDYDEIELIYPVNLTFSDYDQATVESDEGLIAFQNQCATGALYNDNVACIDPVYPMSMAMLHNDNLNFETVSVNSDKEMFLYLEDLQLGGITASMNYPLFVQVNNGELIQVLNNSQFKNTVRESIPLCD